MDRRDFIKTTIVTSAMLTAAAKRAAAAPSPKSYPKTKLAALFELAVGEAKLLQYPDKNSPIYLVKIAEREVVAYSALCTHRGCQVIYKSERFLCSCHYSAFDPKKDGACYQGFATDHLPKVVLEIEGDDVYAVRMEGLIWGREANL